MFLHTDSTTETFDEFHVQMAQVLRIDNRPFEFDYVFITDREKALKDSQMRNFARCLHLLCCRHLGENLIGNCKYGKKSQILRDLVDHVMGKMAGCESEEEFASLKEEFAFLFENAFAGNYFDDFCWDLLNYVVKPRLKAPKAISKYIKTNGIESSNGRCKLETEHKPRTIPEAGLMLKDYVGDMKWFMIQALYNEGPWRLSKHSKIKPVSRACWEKMKLERQERHFAKCYLGQQMVQGQMKEVLKCPDPPIINGLSKEEAKAARKLHKESLKVHNEKLKAEKLQKCKDTNKPQLNINDSVKKKINQTDSATANRARPKFN